MNPMIPSPYAIQPSALAKLSLRDKLLLAQAVHEIGTSPPDWGRVSALLLAHPLVRQQSRLEQAASAGLTLGRIFGTRECERAWTALMRQRGLVLSKDELPPEPPATPTTPKPKEPRGLQPRTDRRSQLALAQLLYAERMEELKEQIKEKEEQFRSLVKEIDEIKSGKADARLEMELRIEMENLANGPPLPPSTPVSAAASVAGGPTTPGSTASTTPKSGKKGRARGESSATNPGDLSAGSAPNSAKAKKDRRASIDAPPSPTKLIPGPTPALPSTPSISLPPPKAAASTAVQGDGAGEMTTEEAEQAVATAATEAAVKALQDEKAASKALQEQVDQAAEKVVESETRFELAAQAEGSAAADEGAEKTTEQPATAPAAEGAKSNEAPAADVVVKEKVPATEPVDGVEASASGKRKRDDEEVEGASAEEKKERKEEGTKPAVEKAAEEREGSPTKKARTTTSAATTASAEEVPSSDVEMDSEDEAEAAIGADDAAEKADKPADTAQDEASAEITADDKTAAEPSADLDLEDEPEDASEAEEQEQVKSVQSLRSKPLPAPSSSPSLPPSKSTPTLDKAAKRKTAQVLTMLLTEVSNHTHGNLFHAPIKEQDAPDYYTLIKQPLDIKTIKARIKEGSIGSAKELRKALGLMFANSLIYNRPGTEVHRMANEMYGASEEIFRRFEGTQRF